MLAAYQILDYKSFKQLDEKQLQNMTRNVNGTPTKLSAVRVKLVVDKIDYIRFHEANRDYDLATDPRSWNREDFRNWKQLGRPKSIAVFTPEQKRLDKLWKEYDLSVSTAAASTATPTTEPVVTDNRIISKDDKNSNLGDVAAFATSDATADDIDNVKLTLG